MSQLDKTEIKISKRKFATELKQLVNKKWAETNHYVSGCDSPFSYLQVADVQESLREIENTLNIKTKEQWRMTDLTTVVYTALIVFGIIGLTEIAFMWYDISHHDKTDDDIQEQWCSENIKH